MIYLCRCILNLMLSLSSQALMNACIDTLSVYRTSVANQPQSSGLIAPHSLRLLPLFILAIMKHVSMTLFEQEIIHLCFLEKLFHSPMCFNYANPVIFSSPDPPQLSSPVYPFLSPYDPAHRLSYWRLFPLFICHSSLHSNGASK